MVSPRGSGQGKAEVVVITGASAGIGRAVARAYGRRGARIGLLARGVEGLAATQAEIAELGGQAIVLPTDVADEKQVEAAAKAVEAAFGPIDVWINDAMASVLAPLPEVTPEEFRRVTEVTYLGYVWGTMAALKRMRARDRGTIVQVGSALAYRAIPLQAAYCGAKHAIRGFTESVRCELIHDKSNVKICLVELPGVNTPQFEWMRNRMPNKPRPVGKMYQPEVAAEAIVWVADHGKRELYVGSQALKAIWGDKVAPGALDRYLARTVYEGHQTKEPDDPRRKDNLWLPVEGNRGAHGPFDSEAQKQSAETWAATHKPLMAAAVGAGLALLVGLLTQRHSDTERRDAP